jgi:SET domain-containing protein
MLLVKTKVKYSDIAGMGLFADEFIPKGTCVWKFGKGFDIRVGKDYPKILIEPAKSFFLTYAYQNPKTLNYVLCADDARFFNHSDTPNTHCVENPDDEDNDDVASRDIIAGEELTVDYRTFDTHPFDGFIKKNR